MSENDKQARLDEYEADFALGGEVEFEAQDDDADTDLEMLMAGVRAARMAGA
jgi:hypothetical protein